MIRVLLDWRSLRFKRELNTRFEEQRSSFPGLWLRDHSNQVFCYFAPLVYPSPRVSPF